MSSHFSYIVFCNFRNHVQPKNKKNLRKTIVVAPVPIRSFLGFPKPIIPALKGRPRAVPPSPPPAGEPLAVLRRGLAAGCGSGRAAGDHSFGPVLVLVLATETWITWRTWDVDTQKNGGFSHWNLDHLGCWHVDPQKNMVLLAAKALEIGMLSPKNGGFSHWKNCEWTVAWTINQVAFQRWWLVFATLIEPMSASKDWGHEPVDIPSISP